MSAIIFQCPRCGTKLEVDKSGIGQRAICLDCGLEFKVPKPERLSEADSPHKPPKSKKKKYLYIVIGFSVWMAIGISSTIRRNYLKKHPAAVAPKPPTAVTPKPPASTAAPKPQGSKWIYTHFEEAMYKGRQHNAILMSENEVNFGFPYQGPQRGRLRFRFNAEKGFDLILHINKGQFLVTSFEDSTALVRFDDNPPVKFKVVGPNDQSTTSLFFRDVTTFIQMMKGASRVRISAPVYEEGNPVFEFDVRGFDGGEFLKEDQS